MSEHAEPEKQRPELLEAGEHVLSAVWGSTDLNVKSLTLKKIKEASEDATELGKDTPAVFTDEISGANGAKDYELNVQDAGEYTVTYTVAPVEAADFAAGTPGIHCPDNLLHTSFLHRHI